MHALLGVVRIKQVQVLYYWGEEGRGTLRRKRGGAVRGAAGCVA